MLVVNIAILMKLSPEDKALLAEIDKIIAGQAGEEKAKRE